MGDAMQDFYTRQMRLKQVGPQGQQKLADARVLVVGAGGLGCPVLQYLTAAGVGHITVCDADSIEESNLHRQPLFSYSQIGEFKAQVAANKCRQQNPFISIEAITENISLSNVEFFLQQHDLIIDCTDNFGSTFLIHDACFLQKKDLVQASIYQFEGQAHYFPFSQASEGCLNCLWPAKPEENCVGNCAQVGVLGSVAGILGAIQANIALLHLLFIETIKPNTTWAIDLLSLQTNQISWAKREDCKLCGMARSALDLKKLHGIMSDDFKLSDLSRVGSPYVLVDIREAHESISDPISVPMDNICLPLSGWVDGLHPQLNNRRGAIILFCHLGQRSDWLARKLINNGHKNIYSLQGGVSALRQQYFNKECI